MVHLCALCQEVGDGGRPSGVGGEGGRDVSPVCPLSGRGRRGTERGQMAHLCALAVLCSPARSPHESSGCIWSRCCPSLHRQHSSQMGHRRKSSPRKTSAEWHASTTQTMHRGHGVRYGGKTTRVFSAPLNLRRMRQALLEIRHSEEQAGARERRPRDLETPQAHQMDAPFCVSRSPAFEVFLLGVVLFLIMCLCDNGQYPQNHRHWMP